MSDSRAQTTQLKLLSALVAANVISASQAQAHPPPSSIDSIISEVGRLVGNEDALVNALAEVLNQKVFPLVEEGRTVHLGDAGEHYCYYDGALYVTNILDQAQYQSALGWARKKRSEGVFTFDGDPKIGIIGGSKLDSMRGVDVGTEEVTEADKQMAQNRVDELIKDAASKGATDIHLEPTVGGQVKVRYRIDGKLRSVSVYPSKQHASLYRVVLEGRCKLVLDIGVPQDGKFELPLGTALVSLRVSSIPVVVGVSKSLKLVLRLLGATKGLTDITKINLSPENLEILTRLCNEPSGIIGLSGPTGAGKSATLGLLAEHAKRTDTERNYHTIEDPVETQRQGMSHTEISPTLSFAAALRSVLRQDPDFIILGEIRDTETAVLAYHCSMTGHIVLTSLHTNNAHLTIERLVELGVSLEIIANNTAAFAAQRLVRKLCTKCRVEYRFKDDQLASLYSGHIQFKNKQDSVIYKANPAGCQHCGSTSGGYAGRHAVLEVLELTESVRDKIAAGVNPSLLRRQMIADGDFFDLWHDGLRLVLEGATSLKELARVLGAYRPPVSAHGSVSPESTLRQSGISQMNEGLGPLAVRL